MPKRKPSNKYYMISCTYNEDENLLWIVFETGLSSNEYKLLRYSLSGDLISTANISSSVAMFDWMYYYDKKVYSGVYKSSGINFLQILDNKGNVTDSSVPYSANSRYPLRVISKDGIILVGGGRPFSILQNKYLAASPNITSSNHSSTVLYPLGTDGRKGCIVSGYTSNKSRLYRVKQTLYGYKVLEVVK